MQEAELLERCHHLRGVCHDGKQAGS
jgi:hypothetical protein